MTELPRNNPDALSDIERAFISAATGRPLEYDVLAVDEEYEASFWQPYLGPIAFALWRLLRIWQPGVEDSADHRWPTISVIAKTIGIGDRFTILGRAATATRPAQRGVLQQLVDEGLLIYGKKGKGRGSRYWFVVRTYLPVLTPGQLKNAKEDNRIPAVLVKRHRQWLEQRELLDRWVNITAPTLIHPFGMRQW